MIRASTPSYALDGVNVFRRFVKDLSRAEPLKRASANLHVNFPFEKCIMPMNRVDGSWSIV